MKTARQEATAAVLGAVLLSDRALDIVIEERIQPEHFPHPAEREIYRAMRKLHDDGQPVDQLTVKAATVNSPDVGDHDVALLAGEVPSLGNLRGYCEIVRSEGWWANAAAKLTAAADRIEARDRDGFLAHLAGVDQAHVTEEAIDQADEFIAWYEAESSGIAFPFAELNEATAGGMNPGETTMVAGWSGMGKSVWSSQCLLHAQSQGARVHEYANEMNGPRRTARLISNLTGIPTARLASKGSLTTEDWKRVLPILSGLRERGEPFRTSPTDGWPVEEYCRQIRRRKDDLAVIDTVTNLPCSRVSEWDRACIMLNDAAAQSKTHLILVSQLNLERDKSAIKPTPTGRDLRNTGLWYHRARIVMFVHREQELVDDGHGGKTDVAYELPEGHIRVDKASHGDKSRGYIGVFLNTRFMRFDRLVTAPNESWQDAA